MAAPWAPWSSTHPLHVHACHPPDVLLPGQSTACRPPCWQLRDSRRSLVTAGGPAAQLNATCPMQSQKLYCCMQEAARAGSQAQQAAITYLAAEVLMAVLAWTPVHEQRQSQIQASANLATTKAGCKSCCMCDASLRYRIAGQDAACQAAAADIVCHSSSLRPEAIHGPLQQHQRSHRPLCSS